MQLEYLEYFSKIEEGYSLNVLSQKLYISQQGLSTVIKILEKEMECQLLVRTGKGVYFTSAGAKLKRYTLDYLEKLREIKVSENPLSGNLFVPVMGEILSTLLAKSLGIYMEENPGVTLNFCYEGSLEKCLQYIKNGEAEIALGMEIMVNRRQKKTVTETFQNLLERNGCEFYIFRSVRPCVECHKELLKCNKSIYLCELSPYNCILYPYGENNDFIRKIQDLCNCSSPLYLEKSYRLYCEKILNKQGYGLVAENELSCNNHDDRLIHVPLKDDINMQIGYIAKKDTVLSPQVLRLTEILKF